MKKEYHAMILIKLTDIVKHIAKLSSDY